MLVLSINEDVLLVGVYPLWLTCCSVQVFRCFLLSDVRPCRPTIFQVLEALVCRVQVRSAQRLAPLDLHARLASLHI